MTEAWTILPEPGSLDELEQLELERLQDYWNEGRYARNGEIGGGKRRFNRDVDDLLRAHKQRRTEAGLPEDS